MTIGETIRERTQGEANASPDLYANELYTELSQVAETSFSRRLENFVSSHILHRFQKNILSMIVDHLYM